MLLLHKYQKYQKISQNYFTTTPPLQLKLHLSALHCTYRTTDSPHVPDSMSSCLPQVSSRSPSHISGKKERTKTKGTPIQGEKLPSPSHNVLTNPPESYKVKAHNGIVESAKTWYIQLDLTSTRLILPHSGMKEPVAPGGETGQLRLQQSCMQKQCTNNYGTSL